MISEQCKKLKKVFHSAETALIISHIDPDGDSIGSMLCLGMLLAKLGVDVDYYSEDGVPKVYKFLPWSDKIKNRVDAKKDYDMVITVDSSDVKRVGKKIILQEISDVIVNIDHHPDNTNFGTINCVKQSASTAELIYKMANNFGLKIDQDMAKCLYVALITDTGNFRYENTSKETFLMAAELLETGIKTHLITTKIYDTRTVPMIRLFAAAMATLETTEKEKAAWVTVTQETLKKFDCRSEQLVGLVDHIRSIASVEVAMLFREEKDGTVKVNFRAKDKVNVSEIAKKFGGGGHFKASGAVINEPINSVKEQVIKEVEKHL